jgi:hypothetical protein
MILWIRKLLIFGNKIKIKLLQKLKNGLFNMQIIDDNKKKEIIIEITIEISI